MVVNLPDQIREIHPIAKYIKYLYNDCYEEDYDAFWSEYHYDNYSYHYSFLEWYFLYRRQNKLHSFEFRVTRKWSDTEIYKNMQIYKMKYPKYEKRLYKFTPQNLIIGGDRYLDECRFFVP
jgi:hypothetical protein